jgi:hypothetical protein
MYFIKYNFLKLQEREREREREIRLPDVARYHLRLRVSDCSKRYMKMANVDQRVHCRMYAEVKEDTGQKGGCVRSQVLTTTASLEFFMYARNQNWRS